MSERGLRPAREGQVLNGYLLDTNHCSRLLEGHPVIVERLDKLGGARVVTCVIVRGELIFMAQRSEHPVVNEARVRDFLAAIGVYLVDAAAADVYGKLKAAVIGHFGPRNKTRRRKTKIEEIGFQENDLWIAAIAKRHGLVVVSADRDFERMAEAGDLSIEKWWSPEA